MLKIIQEKFGSMELITKKIMKYGFYFSFGVCLIAMAVLVSYEMSNIPDLYYIGLSVFQLSLFFVVEFIICGIAMDTIKKQMC